VAGVIAILVIVGGLAASLATVGSSPEAQPPPLRPAPSAPTQPINGVPAVPQVAWVDYSGFLHLGDLNGLSQRVVTWAEADPTSSLVSLADKVFWVQVQRANGQRDVHPRVASFDLSTGRTQKIAAGSQVFAALDRSFIYVESNDRQLAEYWPNGAMKRRELRLPKGWFLSESDLLGNPTPVVANGILVESAPQQVGTTPSTLAIWDPSTETIHRLGKTWKVVGTYTARGARNSLVAWAPAACEFTKNCSLQITETSDFTSRRVSSPLGYGFDWGGGFSPDGRQLAVFVKSNSGFVNPTTQLALVTMDSGAVRLVPGADITIGDSLAWAQWLPDGRRLIVGGTGGEDGMDNVDNHFVVDSWTDLVTPFRFLADRNQDINYSAVAVS
jgi:hypothetical protein